MRVCCWSGCSTPSSVCKSLSQLASLAAKVRVIYSALLDDSATLGCLLEHQLTGPPFSMKMKLNGNFRLSLSPAQSESE